jgi:type 1 fimbria pilin
VVVYLVKTGTIALGRHAINMPLYTIDYNGTQWATGSLQAAITVSGCELPGAPFKQIDVVLGDHDTQVFSGKGSASTAVEFDIPLHGCLGETGNTYEWNYFRGNYANLKLDPAQGAQVVDAAQGLLGLKPGSTASGVGVQVLQPDGTPMVLGQEIRLNRITNGTTLVPLKARYVQTTDQSPEPGSATSAAHFTVTYQ